MRKSFNASAPYTNIDKLKDGEVVHIPTGTSVTKDQMMDAIESSRVIYVSEQHDNLAAHKVQLAVIKDLNERYPGKVVVGMEMFRRSAQKELNKLEQGSMSLDEFNDLFDQYWSGTWREAYQPVLDYIQKESILTLGLKSTEKTEATVRSGKTSHAVPEMDLDDKYHKERFFGFFGKKAPSNAEEERRYKMMVLWDEAMAATVAEFLSDPANKDKKMVVIAGGGHIEHGIGIPKRVFRRIPHQYSIVAPLVADERHSNNMPLHIADYVVKVPYEQRDARLTPKSSKFSRGS